MTVIGPYQAKLALFTNGMTVHYEVAKNAFEFLQDLKENDPDLFDRLCEQPEAVRASIKEKVVERMEPVPDIGIVDSWAENNVDAVMDLTPLCTEKRSALSKIVRECFNFKDQYKLTDPFKKVRGEPVTGYSDVEHTWVGGCRPNYATLRAEDELRPPHMS
ncbi:MAG: hypothetical protein CMH27_09895 [Micavibrio sp.]|nr:hypothetical protein [Micavibrio sp.]